MKTFFLVFCSDGIQCGTAHTEGKHITDCWIIFVHHDYFIFMSLPSRGFCVMSTWKIPFCATMINFPRHFSLFFCFLCSSFQVVSLDDFNNKVFVEVLINKKMKKVDEEGSKVFVCYTPERRGILNMFEPLSTFPSHFTSLFFLKHIINLMKIFHFHI